VTSPSGPTDDDLAVQIEHAAGEQKALLRVEGDVDVASAGRLSSALDHVIAAGATDVHVDLAGVPFLDSTGLTALLTARAQLEGRGTIVVDATSPAVRRTFEIAGLLEVFGTA
jgi:anti-anti-sigma factor